MERYENVPDMISKAYGDYLEEYDREPDILILGSDLFMQLEEQNDRLIYFDETENKTYHCTGAEIEIDNDNLDRIQWC